MVTGQTPTYHLAPNFSILPPPDGPIHLGSIIMSLEGVEVLNDDCLTEPEKTWTHKKHGFTAKWSQIRKGEYGIWAEFLGMTGVGGQASVGHEHSDEDEYSFQGEDTTYFSPSMQYIKNSMNQPGVAEWVDVLNYKPVYMVTGLKIARGPSAKLKNGRKWNVKTRVGVQVPNVPLQLGPQVEHSSERAHEESWESSDDFVFGIRVLKLVFKRSWFVRGDQGEFQPKPHNKGAKLVDAGDLGQDSGDADDDVVVIGLDAELQGKESVTVVGDTDVTGEEEAAATGETLESKVEETWIVPRRVGQT